MAQKLTIKGNTCKKLREEYENVINIFEKISYSKHNYYF